MDTPHTRGLSLIVFAFNEEMNVAPVLEEILTWCRARAHPWELVFVDDGSRDATFARAEEVCATEPNARCVRLERNSGIGAAIKAGFRAGTLPWVTFLPCDGQIPVGELDVLLNAAKDGAVDTVFSVYADRDDGWHRTALSWSVRALIRAVHGVTMRSDGPYLFKRARFDPELLVPNTFFLNFEFPIRAMRARWPVRTVTIHCVPRRAGVSKSTGLKRIVGVARDLAMLRVRLFREK